MSRSVSKVREYECCGCEACVQICPKYCISMYENERGFLMPSVDEKNCVRCGLCRRVCPEVDKKEKLNTVIKAYAAINKQVNEHKQSTSGGVFYVLAKYVIEHGGIVVGASWTSKLIVEHILVNNLDDLQLLSQSKYVQSKIGKSYILVKKEIEKGTLVLFSGTGCQIAGLKQFLNIVYSNLITVEVACHGVPSPGLFRKYIHWRETEMKDTIIRYSFRNRDKHDTGEHFMSCAEFKTKGKKYYYIDRDPYYSSFLNGRTLRETCYQCKYKNENRISDITLSDFWGIEKEIKDFPAHYGVSAVMLNTSLGMDLFNKIVSSLIVNECNVRTIYSHNKSMIQSCMKEKINFQYTISEDFTILSKRMIGSICFKKRMLGIVKRVVPNRIKYILKRI